MKTAMQELWDYIDANYHEEGFNLYDAKEISLEKEKEQIIETSKNSYIAGYLDNQCKVDESMNFPEEYYNQTYNDATK